MDARFLKVFRANSMTSCLSGGSDSDKGPMGSTCNFRASIVMILGSNFEKKLIDAFYEWSEESSERVAFIYPLCATRSEDDALNEMRIRTHIGTF